MRASRIALPLAVLSLGLAACGGDDGDKKSSGYPSEVKANFLNACKTSSGGKEDACKCALAKLEESVPFEEFKKADEAIRAGDQADKGTQDKITKAIQACA